MLHPDSKSEFDESIENVYGSKLVYQSIHHLCRNDQHRCCEFVVEIHPDSIGAKKYKIGILMSLLATVYSSIIQNDGYILCISLSILCIIIFKQSSTIVKESVLVEMDIIGIQQTRTNYFGIQTSEVIQKKDIQDVVINEIITMNKVIFYLAVIMKDNSVKPLYQYLLPRLKCLKCIYQEIQDTLWTHTSENM